MTIEEMKASLDFDELDRVARAVKPSRWKGHGSHVSAIGEITKCSCKNDDSPTCTEYYGGRLIAESISGPERDFIATFDPPTILTLLALARR